MARQGSGNSQALALTAGEVCAALCNRCVKAVFKLTDKGSLCHVNGMPQAGIVCMLITKAQVFGNGSREEPRFLRHIRNVRAEFRLWKIAYIGISKGKAPPRYVAKAKQHLCDGGFAGAGVANDCGSLTALQRKAQVLQGIFIGIVEAEACVIKVSNLIRLAKRYRFRRSICNSGLLVYDFGRALKAGEGSWDSKHGKLSHHHKKHNQHGVFNEGGDRANLHGVNAHAIGTGPHNKRFNGVHQEECRAIRYGKD